MREVYLADGNMVALCSGRDDPLQQRLGDLVCDVDGYYKFFPTRASMERGGYWEPWILRRIADIVDNKNANWDAQVKWEVGAYEAQA